MPISETPSLLILGDKQDYIDRLRSEYDNKIITIPEGKKVLFFLSKDINCVHAFCGKNGKNFNPFRAQRILWIKYILENKETRIIKQSTENTNVVFYCEQLGYLVVCSVMPRGDFKFITQYIADKRKKAQLADTTRYIDFNLEE